MGLEVLFWIWVLTWMTKTAATDVLHAVKGTPNPRYELKRERALKAGQPVKGQPRYGTKDYAADFMADFLKAKTEKRRELAKAKAQPVDSMVDAVREPRPATKPVPVPAVRHETPEPPAPKPEPIPDTRPDARIIQFPIINKEIIMANSEATSLATAIAFAGQAATAHTSFATTGAEGYVGALEQGGNTGEVIGTAREAMEASGIAAEKWAAHKATLEAQQSVKEAYQGTPGAGDKQFLLNG